MIAGHAGEALAAAHAVGELLAVAPVEEGFVVVEVELRGAAGLEEVDDAFGFSCEVRKGGGGRRGREGRRVRRGDGGGGGVAAEKVGEGDATETEGEAVETFASAELLPGGVAGAERLRGRS